MRRNMTSLFSVWFACAITAAAFANPPMVNFRTDPFVDGFNLFNMGDEPGSLVLANFFADPTKPFSLVTANKGITPVPGVSGKLAVRLSFDGQTWTNTGFLTPAQLPVTTFNLVEVIAADLNGDFVDDLVCINSYDPSALFLHLHDKLVIPDPTDPLSGNAGSFTRIYPQGTFVGTLPRDVAVGDIDGDSLLDIAVTSPTDGTIVVLFYRPGPGNDPYPMSDRVTISSVAEPTRLALQDVTGDNLLDLVVSDTMTGTVKILAGDGAGGFPLIGSVNTSANELALGDLDNDGDLDLVVDPGSGGMVTAFFNDGAGAFGASIQLDVPAGACEILIRDYNNDGRNDISVCGAGGLDTVSVAINNVSGGFFPKADFDLGVNGPNPKSMKSVDFDQDGQLDIAVSVGTVSDPPNDHSNVLILFNTTDSILIGDINGDGVVDGADLAILLTTWGDCPRSPAPCPADLNSDSIVNGVDLATLLANWTDPNNPPPPLPGMMAPDAGDPSSTNLAPDDAAPNNQTQAPDVPWILAELGFTSVAEYVEWVDALTEAELFEHIQVLLQMIQQ